MASKALRTRGRGPVVPLSELEGMTRASRLQAPRAREATPAAPTTAPTAEVEAAAASRMARSGARWTLDELAGRLVELTGAGDTAALTLAFTLVCDAQRSGETVAWLADHESCFFPPDAAECGADLENLVVVRVDDRQAMARAADRLLRSGGFGLVVMDLVSDPLGSPRRRRHRGRRVPMAVEARLRGLAKKHAAAVLCLTGAERGGATLGSLVSLRARAYRQRSGEGRFDCALEVMKDKQRAPGWTHVEVCRGPAGVR